MHFEAKVIPSGCSQASRQQGAGQGYALPERGSEKRVRKQVHDDFSQKPFYSKEPEVSTLLK